MTGVAREKFDKVMDRFKELTNGGLDIDLKAEELRRIVAAEREIIRIEHGKIPDDPTSEDGGWIKLT